MRRAYPLAILGFFWILLAFVGGGPAYEAGAHPFIPAYFGILSTLLVWPLVFGLSTPQTLERNLMALFIGAESVFIMIGGVLGVVAPVAYFGSTVVSLIAAVGLVRLYLRTRAKAVEPLVVPLPPPGGGFPSA
jgi:hypothetical protein